MFIDMEAALQEFHRLLKPGGRFLVGCCNSRGRWLRKAVGALAPRAFNWPVVKTCVNALLTGHRPHVSPNYTTIRGSQQRCERQGFRLLTADFDGHIDNSAPSPCSTVGSWGSKTTSSSLARRW